MNDFLTLLLPWQETSNNQISDIFVSIIGASFLILLIYFYRRISRRFNLLRSLTQEIHQFSRPAQPSILQVLKEKFNHKEKFSEAWQEFEDSLITRQHNENQEIVYKTGEAAYYFSEDRLLKQYMNVRFWNSIPAILVGFGILGTFVGLVWGLIPFSDTNFQNTEEIKNAIEKLLSGVSTAFVTSVWGMVASLLFNIIEKWAISRVNSEIANLQHSLDNLFTLTVQQEIAFQQADELEQQTAALKSFSTDLANDIKSAMAEGRQELITELHNTTKSFSTAITDMLGPAINNLQPTITNLKDDITTTITEGRQEILTELKNAPEAFGQSVVNQLQPSLDKLNIVVEELQKVKEESSTEAIRELVEEFKKALSGSFTEEIETLVKNLSTVSQNLLQLPDQMKSMMDGVQVKIDDICKLLQEAIEGQTTFTENTVRTILQELQKTIDNLKDAIDSTTSTATTESAELIKQIRESVDAAADRLINIFEEGETRVSTLLTKQGELIDAVDLPISKSKETLETGNRLLEKVNTSISHADEMIVTMQAFSDHMNGASSTLKTAGDNLTQTSMAFNEQNKEYLEKNRETNQNIQESLQKSQELLDEFAGKFETIESGLQGIFAEIEQGLTNYSTITRDSIEKNLDAFTKELTSAAEALAGSVSVLDHSVEELTEMNDRLTQGVRNS